MMRGIKRLLLSVWRRMFPLPAAPSEAATPAPRVRRPRREKEHHGAHYYLGDLLDTLDATFSHLPAFKKGDPEAFGLFQKVGASVMSSDFSISGALDPYTLQQMPSFGCFYSQAGEDTENRYHPRFLYFMKETRPINVQASNHTIYRCGATFHLHDRPAAVAATFYVAVSRDGTIIPLRVCTPRHHKPGFARMEWGYPTALEDWSADAKLTVEEHVCNLFTIMAEGSLSREVGLTVRVRKRKMAAAFAIDMTRTPYFFADREKTVTENGATQKILHIVRGHWRTVAGGERVFIKSHFRGLRSFVWNGYDVTIGLAGRHGKAMSSATFAAVDPMGDLSGTLTTAEVGEAIDRAIV